MGNLTWHYAWEREGERANEIVLIDVFVHDLEADQSQVWITDDEMEHFVPNWVEPYKSNQINQ